MRYIVQSLIGCQNIFQISNFFSNWANNSGLSRVLQTSIFKLNRIIQASNYANLSMITVYYGT